MRPAALARSSRPINYLCAPRRTPPPHPPIQPAHATRRTNKGQFFILSRPIPAQGRAPGEPLGAKSRASTKSARQGPEKTPGALGGRARARPYDAGIYHARA